MTSKKPIETIGIRALTNRYNAHAQRILVGRFIEQVPERKRGAPRVYRILAPLPSKEEYDQLFRTAYTASLGVTINDAFSEVESLRDELQDWYDNLPDSFRDGEKGDELQEAISALESVSEPQVPTSIDDLPVFRVPSISADSRADRLGDVIGALEAAEEAIAQKVEAHKDAAEVGEWEELASELSNARGEWEGVSFPGMY